MARLPREYPLPVSGRVVVVGVCAAGKSTLVALLRAAGYAAQSCAQEHSYVADMWRRLSRPQALVFVDASLAVIRRRRAIAYEADYIAEQRRRLTHARAHCHVYVLTDDLTPLQVRDRVTTALMALGVGPANREVQSAAF